MSNINDKRLILKQTIIQKDLIEKNYDKQRFLKYCGEKKANGSDIKNWTLIQLNDLVVSFIKNEMNNNDQTITISSTKNKEELNTPTPTQNTKIEEDKDKYEGDLINITKSYVDCLKTAEIEVEREREREREKERERERERESTKQEKIPIINKETLEQYEVIQCQKQEFTQLNNKQVIVIIKDTSINDATLFDFSQITYEIITQEFNWNVKRTYSDFKWLRPMLHNLSPKTTVPLLPKKMSRLKRVDIDLMKKQIKYLQKFIDECLLKEIFKSSDALLSFLSIADRTQFENKMKESTFEQLVFKADEIKTLTGTVLLSDIELDDNYYNNIAHYLESKSKILIKLNSDIKKYHQTINAASHILEEISKDFEALFQLNDQVELKEEITKGYHELSLFINNMRIITLNQSNLMRIHLKEFFKNISHEEIALSELLKIRDEVNSKYIEFNKINLRNTKPSQLKERKKSVSSEDKSIVTRNSKQSVSLGSKSIKGTELGDNLHNHLRYLNMAIMNEITAYVIEHDKRFEDNIKSFTDSFFPTLTDAVSVWTVLTIYLNKN